MIQVWHDQTDGIREVRASIDKSLDRLAETPDSYKTFRVLDGIAAKLANGQPFQAAVLLRNFAELTERGGR